MFNVDEHEQELKQHKRKSI